MNVLLLRLQEYANHYAREELRAMVTGSRLLSSQSQDDPVHECQVGRWYHYRIPWPTEGQSGMKVLLHAQEYALHYANTGFDLMSVVIMVVGLVATGR